MEAKAAASKSLMLMKAQCFTAKKRAGGKRCLRATAGGPSWAINNALFLPDDLADLDSELALAAAHHALGSGCCRGLRKASGSGAERITNIFTGEHAAPQWLTAAKHQIFFVADDGEHGQELWLTKGAQSTTNRLLGLASRPQPERGSPRGLALMNYNAFFVAESADCGRELWVIELCLPPLPARQGACRLLVTIAHDAP